MLLSQSFSAVAHGPPLPVAWVMQSLQAVVPRGAPPLQKSPVVEHSLSHTLVVQTQATIVLLNCVLPAEQYVCPQQVRMQVSVPI